MLRSKLELLDNSDKYSDTFFLGSVINACPIRVFSLINLFSLPCNICSFLSSGVFSICLRMISLSSSNTFFFKDYLSNLIGFIAETCISKTLS